MSGARLKRRALLIGGAAAAWAGWTWGLPPLRRLFAGPFDFEPMDDPAGFRRIAGGSVSGGFDPLLGVRGLDRGETARAAAAAVERDLCGALFGPGWRAGAGVVPVASFSDYYCPYCRVLTATLARMVEEPGSAIHVRWHEWPLLGSASDSAARAALAAEAQGAYARFHQRLMRARFIPTEDYLRLLAERIGIDADRMLADMASAEVAARIETARALAARFGFAGTPALVVGRTVVNGAVDEAMLRALIETERAEEGAPPCAVA